MFLLPSYWPSTSQRHFHKYTKTHHTSLLHHYIHYSPTTVIYTAADITTVQILQNSLNILHDWSHKSGFKFYARKLVRANALPFILVL